MKKALKILGILILVGAMAGYLVYEFVINKSHPDYIEMEAEYNMLAADLYNAFEEDKIKADQKYNGKMIALKGSLNKVESADSILTAIFVFNRGMFGDEGVRVSMLPGFHDEMKKLNLPAEVKLKAYCIGSTDADVILHKGSLLSN